MSSMMGSMQGGYTSGTSIMGSIGTGTAQMSEGQSQAWVLRRSADLAYMRGLQEAQVARWGIDKLKKEKKRFLAKQHATYAKSGVTLEGSPLEVMEETRQEFTEDIGRLIEAERDIKYMAFYEKLMTRLGAKQVERAGKVGMINTILSSVSSASMY